MLPAVILAGCGGARSKAGSSPHSVPHALAPSEGRGPALGLTEDNAELLWNPGSGSRPGGPALQSAREQLTAIHPRYIRLLVDWVVLQPRGERPANLDEPVDGCARAVAPCAPYAGIREELAAVASQQRAARAEGRAGFEVVLDVFGVPPWAAAAASGCELPGTKSFSRPLSEAGLGGYRSLIRALLALGRQEGVALEWWSPWNEPNNPDFLSPQRSSCAPGAPSAAPAVYAQLARAMAGELAADGGTHHLLLGELAAYASDSVHRTSVASFVAALPARVLCLGEVWSIHAYAAWDNAQPGAEPVEMLTRALDARGSCAARAQIWVTEAGAGAPHPGRPRPPGQAEETAGCRALGAQLLRWSQDPRVGATFQYSFREDPAFPVGLLSADLRHTYPAYRLWLAYGQARARNAPPPAASCT
ncbi:MAG: hypothetical protein ACHQHO_10360 [Solirubrobacterales bacterium]